MNKYIKKKNYAEELNQRRLEWEKSEKVLLNEINDDLVFDKSLEDFVKVNPKNYNNLAMLSEIINIQEKAKDLLEEKKKLWPEECVIEEFNKKHAIVHSGQTYVLTEKKHPIFKGKDFSLESRQSFKMYYEDETVVCSDGKKRPKAEIWLKSPKRRKYCDIIFDPTMNLKSADNDEYYNMWKGFSIKAKKGDCSKYWEHVKCNICVKDEECYNFVHKWCAYVFQYPDKVHTALVICGSQGVGKNSFVEPLGVLLGSHYVLLSNISELISNFNFHLKNAVLIHANEAFWGGNKKDIGTLKSMITEKTCLIEGKGKDRIMVRNYKHVIMSSNENWPVHLDPDDRRFYVLQVSEKHKEDNVYFKAIQDQLDNDGYEALLYDLLNEDLDEFNPRKLPGSPYAFDLKMVGASSAQKYIYELLLEDRLDLRDGRTILKDEIFMDYKLYCEDNSEKTISGNVFYKDLRKLIPSVKETRPLIEGIRKRAYNFPSLKHCREEFCKSFKATKKIWDDEMEQQTMSGQDQEQS